MTNNTIQLYSLATPNGQKVSIALEEMGLPYNPHTIDIRIDDQFSDEFLAVNPNGKIPAIIDPNGPEGKETRVFESGAILLYLAEKTGQFIPKDPIARIETLKWLFFQMAGVGPMFGQFGHFYKYGTDQCDHPYPVTRYSNETKRLLGVLDKQLSDKPYLIGDDYTIADIATFPWVSCLDQFYGAKDHLGLDDFAHVQKWFDRCINRPAAQKGMLVCAFPERDAA